MHVCHATLNSAVTVWISGADRVEWLQEELLPLLSAFSLLLRLFFTAAFKVKQTTLKHKHSFSTKTKHLISS